MTSDSAAVLLAGGALGVSVISLVFTALERRRRITEVDLLRRQVEGAEEDRDNRKFAHVSAAHGPTRVGSPYAEHEFLIINSGPAIARAVDVWVRNPGGNDITEPYRVSPALGPGEREQARLRVLQGVSRAGGLMLWGRWRDDSGDRQPLALLRLNKHQ